VPIVPQASSNRKILHRKNGTGGNRRGRAPIPTKICEREKDIVKEQVKRTSKGQGSYRHGIFEEGWKKDLQYQKIKNNL